MQYREAEDWNVYKIQWGSLGQDKTICTHSASLYHMCVKDQGEAHARLLDISSSWEVLSLFVECHL